jgi:hypothetical protein
MTDLERDLRTINVIAAVGWVVLFVILFVTLVVASALGP